MTRSCGVAIPVGGAEYLAGRGLHASGRMRCTAGLVNVHTFKWSYNISAHTVNRGQIADVQYLIIVFYWHQLITV